MSWGKECCAVGGGGKGNRELAFFELDDFKIDADKHTNVETMGAYLVPVMITDGSNIYCVFRKDLDDSLLFDWQQTLSNNGILKIGINSSSYDDDRHFRYSLDFFKKQ
jgi:hypothetical protein